MNQKRTSKEIKQSIVKGLDEAIEISKKLNAGGKEQPKNAVHKGIKKNIYKHVPEKEMFMDNKT